MLWGLLLFAALLWGAAAQGELHEVERYTREDLFSGERILLFLHYEVDGAQCLSCEGYIPYLARLHKRGEVRVRRLNFAEDPLLALRFRSFFFPSFFLQEGGSFRNLTSVDFREVHIPMGPERTYDNDIDALLQNPAAVRQIKPIPPWVSPGAPLSSAAAVLLCVAFFVSRALDYALYLVPFWLLSSLLLFLIVLSLHLTVRKQGASASKKAK